MSHTIRSGSRLLLALAVALLVVSPAYAATWTVCSSDCDYISIQAAVDASSDLDTIELGPETFYENVVVDKSLIIRGAGVTETVVDGMESGVVFDFAVDYSGLGVPPTLSDLIVQNGIAGVRSRPARGDLGSGLSLKNCTIRRNAGIGVVLEDSHIFMGLSIRDSLITENSAGVGAGDLASCVIDRSIISHNQGGGVKVAVLPLSKKLAEPARKIAAELRRDWNVFYDEAGNIGRRYRRRHPLGRRP